MKNVKKVFATGLLVISLCLGLFVTAARAASSLTDAQVRQRLRNLVDPTNAPPALLQSTNLTVTGTATITTLIGSNATLTGTVTINGVIPNFTGVAIKTNYFLNRDSTTSTVIVVNGVITSITP